jgi:hypothetical protein
LWIPAACTALAILAVSPRLYLQSTCLSFLFLALTLWLLIAPCTDDGEESANGKRIWWLPLLFALWANCDSWFFLGPLAVVLYLIGELIQLKFPTTDGGPDEARGRQLKTLALVLVVGLAACMINPHHFRVFTLPPELGLAPGRELIHSDRQFRPLYLSPLQSDYYEPNFGRSVAGLSYFPLLLVGVVSFVFVFGRAPWWRLLVWLGFAGLSLYNARCIPFFAIVAGPITALNWLDFAARRLGSTPRLTTGWRWWSLGARVLSVVVVLVLLAATVPGWLQAKPYDYRRVGWRVVADPSLQQTAEQIHAWREQKLLPAEPHWFNMRWEVANYLAWFAPGERVFLDLYLPQFPEGANEYLKLLKNLEQLAKDANSTDEELGSKPSASKSRWKNILRDRRVHFWIYDNLNVQKADEEARRILFSNSDEWILCSIHGRIAIFAWRDPQAKDEPDPSTGLELDLNRLAFGRAAAQAPPQGPEVVVPTRSLWDRWLHGAPPPPMDRQTAVLYDFRFQTAGERQRMLEVYRQSRAWQAAVSAGAIGASMPNGPVPNSLLGLSWSCTYHDLFPPGKLQPARRTQPHEGGAMLARSAYVSSLQMDPPSSIYLALRAARRGLLDNPQDARTHLMLAEEYARLDAQPYERSLKTSSPLAGEIRRTQMVAAYVNCLRFEPTPLMAHEAHAVLFEVFNQLHFLDVTAYHLREWLNKRRTLRPEDLNLSATQHTQILDDMARELKRRDEEVKRELDRYEVKAANKPALEKVAIALEQGLVETALTTLDQAPADELSGNKDPKEMAIIRAVTTVLLDLGRLDKARDSLDPEPEKTAGKPVRPEYLRLHLRLAAARGDYEKADRLLADALDYAWTDPAGIPVHSLLRNRIAAAIGRVMLGEAQRFGGAMRFPSPRGEFPSDFWIRRWRLDALESSMRLTQERAEWHLLRGWLAVESGRCVEARTSFRDALDIVVPPSNWMGEVNGLDVLSPRINPGEVQMLQDLSARQGSALSVSRQFLKWLDEAQR